MISSTYEHVHKINLFSWSNLNVFYWSVYQSTSLHACLSVYVFFLFVFLYLFSNITCHVCVCVSQWPAWVQSSALCVHVRSRWDCGAVPSERSQDGHCEHGRGLSHSRCYPVWQVRCGDEGTSTHVWILRHMYWPGLILVVHITFLGHFQNKFSINQLYWNFRGVVIFIKLMKFGGKCFYDVWDKTIFRGKANCPLRLKKSL